MLSNLDYYYGFLCPITILYGIIFILLYKFWGGGGKRNLNFAKLASLLPGPPDWPIFRSSLHFFFPGKDGTLGVQKILLKKYGPVYRLWFGNQLFVSLSDPSDLDFVFANSHMSARQNILEALYTFAPEGLISTRSISIWRKDRKLLLPFFTRNIIKSQTERMNKIIYEFVENLKNHQNLKKVNVRYLPIGLTTKILCDTKLESNINWDEVTRLNLLDADKGTFQVIAWQTYLPLLHSKLINYFIYKFYMDPATKEIYDFLDNMLKTKTSNKSLNEANETESGASSVLEVLSRNVDRKATLGKLIALFVAGSVGPSKIISFAVLMLAIHQKVQDELYKEICDHFGNNDGPANYEDIESLAYLDQVVKETERRYLSMPFLFRELDEPTQINSRVYPAGTGFLINVGNLHFNSKYYPDPYKFNPDHFKPEAVAKRPKHTFIPFGAGPRGCPAKEFAGLEIKLTIIALLRTFRFHTSTKMADVKLNHRFITDGLHDCYVQCELRKQ